ncbi:MAG: Na+/H+ antiporter [Dokdonella sp.]|uniref:Na+/H+ antiporter n=1 Tax=Dokdonella sp. TaxID=2291710 RepID=UPI0025C18FED|nr:Na+/H+ antiporter [Dokdonella sp.]MBZ0222335.1 Na+/H+ antiporter [Dokdonella sp.]MCC7256181.1 Na+/H+ antiporter [Dokdonella sp.]
MHSIEIVLTMLLLVLASGYLVRVLPIALPLPLVQIALGAGVAAFSSHGVRLDPDLFFVLFLPPLLFLDGWRIPKDGLLHDARPILQLAFGLVVFTVLGVGLFVHWLVPAMPLAVAFALAAIVSPTDPLAVAAIAQRVPVPRRLLHILEGESLLNDASGLVCFRFAVVAAMTGQFSLWSASLSFVWLAVGGIAIGTAVSWGLSRSHRLLTRRFGQDAGLPVLGSLLTPFGAYLAAEHLGASGILAAVAAGVMMSYAELAGVAPATTRLQRAAVWDSVQFALNGTAFVVLGEQLPGILAQAGASVAQSGHKGLGWLLVLALALNFALAGLRLLWTLASLHVDTWLLRRGGQAPTRPSWRLVLAMSLTGVRGAVTLAGVLTLPLALGDGRPFPFRELVIFLAMSVIVFSLLAASFGLPRLLVGLQVPPEPHPRRQEDLARRLAAKAALAEIERVRHAGEGSSGDAQIEAAAATRVIEIYQRRLGGGDTEIDAQLLRRADEAERRLRLAALRGERAELFALARAGRLADDVARRLVREIDFVESRYL